MHFSRNTILIYLDKQKEQKRRLKQGNANQENASTSNLAAIGSESYWNSAGE